jgi:hypothetical protein
MTTAETLDIEELENVMSELDASAVTAPTPVAAVPVATPGNPIETFVNAHQLAKDVRIDPLDLDTACVEHAGLFVHYADQASKARRQYEKMKAAHEVLESMLYAKVRESLSSTMVTETDAKGKEVTRSAKVTEGQIDAAVKADRRWWRSKNRVIDAQAIMDLANNGKAAFEQRRDMIVQMGSDRRIERQGALRVMEVNGARDAARAAMKGADGSRG